MPNEKALRESALLAKKKALLNNAPPEEERALWEDAPIVEEERALWEDAPIVEEDVQKKSPNEPVGTTKSDLSSSDLQTQSQPSVGNGQDDEYSLKNQIIQPDNTPQADREISGLERTGSYMSSFNKGILETIPSSLETIGAATQMIDRHLLQNKDATFEGQYGAKAGEYVRKQIDNLFPESKELAADFGSQVFKGLGQIVPMLATGGESMVVNEINAAQKSTNAALSAVRSIAKAPFTKMGAVITPQIFSSEYKQALEKGATEEQAFSQGLLNTFGGASLELLPVLNVLKRLNSATNGSIRNKLINTAKSTAEEVLTGGLQTGLSNATAGMVYDSNRELLQGVGEAASVDGSVGAILNIALNSLGIRLKKAKKEEVPIIEMAIAETKAEILKYKQEGNVEGSGKTIENEQQNSKDFGSEIPEGGVEALEQTPRGQEAGVQEAGGTQEFISETDGAKGVGLEAGNGPLLTPPKEVAIPVSEKQKMEFGSGYKDMDFKKETIASDKIKITEQPENRDKVDEIKNDIKENGIKEPLIVVYDAESDNYYVKNGNHRATAIKELGIKNVEVIIAEQKNEPPTPKQGVADVSGRDAANISSTVSKVETKKEGEGIAELKDVESTAKTPLANQPQPQPQKEGDVADAKSGVSGDEYNEFVYKGKVSEERLNAISEKEKNGETLTQREKEIFEQKIAPDKSKVANKKYDTAKANLATESANQTAKVDSPITELQTVKSTISKELRQEFVDRKNNEEFGNRDYSESDFIEDKVNEIIDESRNQERDLTPKELSFLNEYSFRPKGYEFDKNASLVPSKPSNTQEILVDIPREESVKPTVDKRQQDTLKMSFGEYKNKYKDANLDEYESYRSSSAEPSITDQISQNKGAKNPIFNLSASPGIFGINLDDIAKPIQEFFKKELTTRGYIPNDVFDAWTKTQGNKSSALQDIKYTASDFNRTVRKDFKISNLKSIPENVLIDINKALAGDIKAKAKLPEATQELVTDMRGQIDALTRTFIDLGIVKGELAVKFEKNIGTYLYRSYRKFDDPAWSENIDPQVVNRVRGWIQEKFPNNTHEETQGYINELMYNPEAPMGLIKSGILGSKDMSILKKRTDIPAEIRALMGEYSDPMLNYAKSITKMVNLLNNHLFLEDVKSKGMNKFLHEKATGKHYEQIAAEGSTTMSPLNGLYTTPEIAQAFKDFNKSTAPTTAVGITYLKLLGKCKVAKTVLSVATNSRNIVGNFGFVIANGHWRVDKVKHITAVLNDIVNGEDKALREAYKRYQKLSILGDGLEYGIFKKVLNEATGKDNSANKDLFGNLNANMLKKVNTKINDVAGTLYRAEDEIFKVYAFENEHARYQKAYPNKSKEEIDAIAADIVRKTAPTYSLTPKAIKTLSKSPIFGTFITFTAEVFRTSGNTFALAYKELKTAETRSIGIERTAGIMAAATITQGTSMATKALFGISDDDEEKIRKFQPEWSKNGDYFYTSKLENGKVSMVDMSASDPHGIYKRFSNALLDGTEPKKAMLDAIDEIYKPFLGLNLLTKALDELRLNRKENGKEVFNPEGEAGDIGMEMFFHVNSAMQAGTITSMQRIYKGVMNGDKPDDYGKIYNARKETIAMFTGQRISDIDITKAFNFKTYEYGDRLKNGFRIYDKAPDSEKEKSKVKANKAIDDIAKELNDLYSSALSLGANRKDLNMSLNKMRIDSKVKKTIKGVVTDEKVNYIK